MLDPVPDVIYVCGPTIYGKLHIGNYRAMVFNDVIRRIYNIPLYIGLTDISDKIETLIIQYETGVTKLIEYRRTFESNLNTMGISYQILPVSQHIDKIDCVINALSLKGLTTENESQIRLKNTTGNHYALWKRNKTINLVSESGRSGHPGWHVQCVGHVYDISKQYENILHSGGIDLKNTHHKYQQIAFDHLKVSVNWLHVQNVTKNGMKMSRSKQNILYIEQFDPLFARYLLLSENYNCRLQLNSNTIHQKSLEYCRIISRIYNLVYLNHNGVIPEIKNMNLLHTRTILKALADNFSLNYVRQINEIYNFLNTDLFVTDKKLVSILQSYNEAKAKKQYFQCDELNKQLTQDYNLKYNGSTIFYNKVLYHE